MGPGLPEPGRRFRVSSRHNLLHGKCACLSAGPGFAQIGPFGPRRRQAVHSEGLDEKRRIRQKERRGTFSGGHLARDGKSLNPGEWPVNLLPQSWRHHETSEGVQGAARSSRLWRLESILMDRVGGYQGFVSLLDKTRRSSSFILSVSISLKGMACSLPDRTAGIRRDVPALR